MPANDPFDHGAREHDEVEGEVQGKSVGQLVVEASLSKQGRARRGDALLAFCAAAVYHFEDAVPSKDAPLSGVTSQPVPAFCRGAAARGKPTISSMYDLLARVAGAELNSHAAQ